ncbi:hypothetical protein KL939_000378 [Ogataea angusta]|nr:hypothetical protein KL939_000378 [Ogataea angusta]
MKNEISTVPDSDFANKFRRVRACARCHRLKMRCVYEDPNFESCTRCFKASLKCSITEDPTETTARSRPRKKIKLKGTGPLSALQTSMGEATRLFQTLQRQMSETTNNSTVTLDGQKLDFSSLDENLNPESLSQLQAQLTDLQRLLAHAVTFSKDVYLSSKDQNVASSINSMKEGPVKSVPNLPFVAYGPNLVKELIKLKILSEEDARSRFDYFLSDVLCFWPCVSIPSHYTYDWLLENEPLVLLAFITVTCLNDADLHDTLLYYLDNNLAQRVGVLGDISPTIVQVYLVLSLWCSPPRKWGSYKHQMSLLTALNLTLCLDLGNEAHRTGPNVLKDGSEERKILRTYIGVYSCCGSLGLSLPRFKVVNWTNTHERCCQILLMGDVTRYDRFLAYYARLVAIGEEIFQFLCPTTASPSLATRLNMLFSTDKETQDETSFPHESLRAMMISYEKKMQKLATESGLLTSESKEKNLLSIIYYQLLMTMYDYVVCRVLVRKDTLTDVYLQTLNRLVRASIKVVDSFVALSEQTSTFPTFFYYRPMHALVALIRSRLLVKSQRLDVEVNVEHEYERVAAALAKVAAHSKVASRMTMILTRVRKWMQVSNNFNRDGATNSMVDLLDELGREKAVENISINLKGKKEGDNGHLNPDSRIQFNKFINYSADNMTRKNSRKLSMSSSRPQSRSGSTYIPSPIGFNSSENNDSPGNGSESVDRIPEIGSIGLENSIEHTTESQNLLNDIFSQIDSDILNFNENSVLEMMPETDLNIFGGEEGYGFW